jgi:hypothetical protein
MLAVKKDRRYESLGAMVGLLMPGGCCESSLSPALPADKANEPLKSGLVVFNMAKRSAALRLHSLCSTLQ